MTIPACLLICIWLGGESSGENACKCKDGWVFVRGDTSHLSNNRRTVSH